MMIKEDYLRCTYFSKSLTKGHIIFRTLIERRNKHNAPEFDFDGATFYVENMEVEYKTNDCHVMRAELVCVDGASRYAGGTFLLDVDYNKSTMTLEEI